MNGDLYPVVGSEPGNANKTASRVVGSLQDTLLKLGFWPAVLAVTAGAVIASNVVSLDIVMMVGETELSVGTNFIMATIVPVLVCPPLAALVLSLAFELDSARKQMETISRIDALTGVANRGYFYSLCRAEFSRAVRHDLPTAVLMIDIDHFKDINDAHGHDVGDAVLVAFARHCEGQLRNEDVFARTGGEEFAVLLPMCRLEDAVVVAEKLRRTIEVLDVTVPEQVVRATISIGVAELTPAETVESVIKRADQNLYAAKSAGRNVIVAI